MNSPFNVFMQAELMRLKKASAPAPTVQSLPHIARRVLRWHLSSCASMDAVHGKLTGDSSDAGRARAR